MDRSAWAATAVLGCAVACGGGGPPPAPSVVPIATSVADAGARLEPPPREPRVTAGAKHVCLLDAKGGVWCWGENYFGQLGDGTLDGRAVAKKVPGLEDAVDVSAGLQETCAVRKTGAVVCWGVVQRPINEGHAAPVVGIDRRYRGVQADPEHPVVLVAMADGNQGRAVYPAKVPGIDDAVSVRVGTSRSCAVRRGGQVACWGDLLGGWSSQLFDATAIPNVNDAIDVSPRSACALRSGGDLLCWKADHDRTASDYKTLTFAPAPTPPPASAVGLVALEPNTLAEDGCGMNASGRLVCWGAHVSAAQAVTAPLASLASGFNDGCAVTRAGSVACWRERMPPPPELGDAASVALGSEVACAARRSGEVLCWGANEEGELGRGTSGFVAAPMEIATDGAIVSVAASTYSTCAVKSSGELLYWGADGSGRFPEATTPHTNHDVADAVEVVRTDGGVCVRHKTGAVSCFGAGAFGRLGDGETKDSVVPVAVVGVRDAVQLSTNYYFTCALRKSGKVACWGALLPHRAEVEETKRTRADRLASDVPGVERAVEIHTGDNFACARLADGAVTCWGRDKSIVYGAPPLAKHAAPTPHRVPFVEGAVELAGGPNHVCARRTDGRTWCWGHLADGIGNEHYELTGESAVALGRGDSARICLVDEARGVVCHLRGRKLGGEHYESVAFEVPGATRIASGSKHTCAIGAGGRLWCWGDNTSGQIGIGVTTYDATPAPVKGLP